MTLDSRSTLERLWQTGNARDWVGFAALLSPELVYEVPQTRERVRGREAYVDFFRTWPGNWRAEVQKLIVEPGGGVTVIDFIVDGEHMTGISFFELTDGVISRITDFWPSPYEPPPRACAWVERY